MHVSVNPDLVCEFEEALVPEILAMAWRYACRLSKTREDAEDLLQDALAHGLVRFDQLRDPTRFRSWLMSIVRTRFLMLQRRVTPDQERFRVDDADAETRLADTAATPEGNSLAEEIALSLSRLPTPQSEILSLFYLEGLNLQETAQVLGITVGAVQQRLFRARGALRRELERFHPASTYALYQER